MKRATDWIRYSIYYLDMVHAITRLIEVTVTEHACVRFVRKDWRRSLSHQAFPLQATTATKLFDPATDDHLTVRRTDPPPSVKGMFNTCTLRF